MGLQVTVKSNMTVTCTEQEISGITHQIPLEADSLLLMRKLYKVARDWEPALLWLLHGS